MIVREVINGRGAYVANYGDMLKVIFDDGEISFLTPVIKNKDRQKFNPNHAPGGSPGGTGGQFTSADDAGGGDSAPSDQGQATDRHGLTESDQAAMQDWLGNGYRDLRTDPEFGKVLEKLPVYNGKVWRGAQVDQAVFNDMKINDTYEITKFSSSSFSQDVAERYALGRMRDKPDRAKVMFEIFDRGRKIPREYLQQAGSDETEIVLMTGDKYRIIGIDRNMVNEHGVKFNRVTLTHA